MQRPPIEEFQHAGREVGEAAGRRLAATLAGATSVAAHDAALRANVIEVAAYEAAIRRDGASEAEALAWRQGASEGLRTVMMRPEIHIGRPEVVRA